MITEKINLDPILSWSSQFFPIRNIQYSVLYDDVQWEKSPQTDSGRFLPEGIDGRRYETHFERKRLPAIPEYFLRWHHRS